MEKQRVLVKEICAEGKNGDKKIFFVEYYLTEEEICIPDGFGMCVYGIEVVKTGDKCAESAYADSLGTDKAAVMEFIVMLARQLVTPAMLFDVIYDRCGGQSLYAENEDRIV